MSLTIHSPNGRREMTDDGAVTQRVEARAKCAGACTRTDLYTKVSFDKHHSDFSVIVDTYRVLIRGSDHFDDIYER